MLGDVSFGGVSVPADCVVRTFRVKVMSTPAKRRQARELLVAGGDVWAWCVDRYHARRRAGLAAANSNTQLWPDLRNHGSFGPLTMHVAQDVAKGWSAAFFESIRRRKTGGRASLPLRKHYHFPVTWRRGEFRLLAAGAGTRARVVLSRARGTAPLTLACSHEHPYDPEQVRAVRLLEDGADLFLDVTAWVKVGPASVEPGRIGGCDPGIIHPLALAAGEDALVISGRAVRAEEFLHLADTKARARHQAPKQPAATARPGRPRHDGSRRWRQLTSRQRSAEARSRRRVKLAANRAARLAACWLLEHQVQTLALGDPAGIERRDAGRIQNRRVGRWARTHTRDALRYRCEEAGISLAVTDERGTSSQCPLCGARATKTGRTLRCSSPTCCATHHRDVAGAQNISRRVGAVVYPIARLEHRRVGTPTRRDRRRHRYDRTRSHTNAVGPARTRAARTKPRESLASTNGEDSRHTL
jgi:transposase